MQGVSNGGVWSKQFGGERLDFAVDGRRGFVVFPAGASPRTSVPYPWVWYAPTFVNDTYPLPKELHAWYTERLLGAGFCVAGVDVGESWGNPDGRAGFTAFHQACVTSLGLSSKACLWPQSRGGLQHYNWAAEHPECVQGIGGIYTLVNLFGLRVADVRLHTAYGMEEETFRRQAYLHNPIDRLAPIARHRVPVFNVHGDSDAVVPLDENVGKLTKRYRALGGEAELLVLPGLGHEEVPAFFTNQALLEFFLNRGR